MVVSFADLPRYFNHVLVDGAFDPLHAGHLKYLKDAAGHGPLLVSVASDAQIREKGRVPCLPQSQRVAVLDALSTVCAVYAKDRPTEQVLAQMRPKAYIKGEDWKGRLPIEQVDVCERLGIPRRFTEGRLDSSGRLLSAWAAERDAKALAELECLVASQKPASEPWQPVTDYSFEARKIAEGKHPELIKEVFHPKCVMDVGCGPGHLVRLLKGIGVDATGVDKDRLDIGDNRNGLAAEHYGSPCGFADLVICREVMEHLTVREVRQAVSNLCALSTKFVYVTTRYAKATCSLLHVETKDDLDPTHISMLNIDLLRTLFVLEGAKRRADLEQRMDWQGKGRVIVYQVA